MIVRIGQIWRENDNRFDREVEIINIDKANEQVVIQTTKSTAAGVGKKSIARLDRFNGKHGGYSLIKDRP